MKSGDIRKTYLDFFQSEGHVILPSAPLVVKNDPSLMFTNAGMNQFKEIFLGNTTPANKRVANTQKCLRVSGKHNDLEEVGHDTYHHTMFEMLGNWSFGDYFKEEAIRLAWKFLTGIMGIPAGKLYATVFEGDREDHLDADHNAFNIWSEYMAPDHILYGPKKDNFWEMGDSGPCGPCSEIHVDLRGEEEAAKTPARELINGDHPRVIEIWNLVFMQFNRKADGSLEALPVKHVDTGLGFERLCMVMQNTGSTYQTDIFQPLIREITRITGKKYGENAQTDTALRVASDHIRAIAFSIADGQVPSNVGAGYVIRRILRRAVRFGYTFLGQDNPFLYRLLPVLAETMGGVFPEIRRQEKTATRVIREEESSFLRTLEKGIGLLERILDHASATGTESVSGKAAFELYDTYGFPLDLTGLMAREKGLTVNRKEFMEQMKQQRSRSKNDATAESTDWAVSRPGTTTEFTGYDELDSPARILRYRTMTRKGRKYYQFVLDRSPFYAESGGQAGDRGFFLFPAENIRIIDTVKENNQVLHISTRMPGDPSVPLTASVDRADRKKTACNHTATHLLHHTLRNILGKHVEQKGSLVHPDYLRFDFSHFKKMSTGEILETEQMVNRMIRENHIQKEERSVPLQKALKKGALAFFGEKYDEQVRTMQFGDSVELCGGTHVKATGEIGFFKIIKETSVAAGIRRIEALTGETAEKYVNEKIAALSRVEQMTGTAHNAPDAVRNIMEELTALKKQLDLLQKEKIQEEKEHLKNKIERIGDINLVRHVTGFKSPDMIKDLAYRLKESVPNLFLVLGAQIGKKALLTIMISNNLVNEKKIDANRIIRDIAPEIEGGGGGQSFYATAGGSKPEGLKRAIKKAVQQIPHPGADASGQSK